MVQAPSSAGAAGGAAANTASQSRSSSSTPAASASAAAASAGGGEGSGGSSSSGGSRHIPSKEGAHPSVAAAGGSSPASAPSSSLAADAALGPPRYLRPPREEDYASAMPDEVLLRAISFLDLDSSVNAAQVAPRWVHLFNELVAQAHCERIYLDQATAKVLNPARFKSSYKAMLRLRPRCRMNGFYYLLSSYIKKPTKDMWTEIKPGTILEVKYWRYLRFLPHGRLVYALLYLPPHEAVRVFREGRHKDLCEGQYYVHKGEVHCEVRTHYALINFRLQLEDGKRGAKFSQLSMLEHHSLSYNDPSGVPVPHRPAYDNFVFYRSRDL